MVGFAEGGKGVDAEGVFDFEPFGFWPGRKPDNSIFVMISYEDIFILRSNPFSLLLNREILY